VDFASTGAELIQGFGGNDTIDGSGGDDVILAGPGDDVVSYWPGARRLSGGDGFDTLLVTGDLDLRDPAATRRHHLLDGIEAIELSDGFANVLTLDLTALVRLRGDRSGPIGLPNSLVVYGEAADTVHTGSGWTFTGTAQSQGTPFDVYTSSRGRATLWIMQGLAVAP